MKPRLVLPHDHYTVDDAEIWIAVECGFGSKIIGDHSVEQDRRDADLMFDLMARYSWGEIYLRVGRENKAVPAVHVLIRNNPLWAGE